MESFPYMQLFALVKLDEKKDSEQSLFQAFESKVILCRIISHKNYKFKFDGASGAFCNKAGQSAQPKYRMPHRGRKACSEGLPKE